MVELHIDFLLNDNGKFAENQRETLVSGQKAMDAKLSFAYKAMYIDLIEYIDCILHKFPVYLKHNTNDESTMIDQLKQGTIIFYSICDYSFIGLNVYNNGTFLILRHFVVADEGMLLLKQSFNFVCEEGDYHPLKILIDYSERNTLSWRISIESNIVTFSEHINDAMYDSLQNILVLEI